MKEIVYRIVLKLELIRFLKSVNRVTKSINKEITIIGIKDARNTINLKLKQIKDNHKKAEDLYLNICTYLVDNTNNGNMYISSTSHELLNILLFCLSHNSILNKLGGVPNISISNKL